jgi:hypothetical protein
VLVEPERFEREDRDPVDLAHPRGLERPHDGVAIAVPLDVEERVGDGMGHLDAELWTPHRVAEDEDALHPASLPRGLSQD